ncbi:MAG: dienelactone hydrolase family protein [Burkholderiales bacterium]
MSMIEFERIDGSSCRGYLAETGKGRPGLVVIQEWWGLNPHMCSIADRLKASGYNALVPDLYHRRVAQNVDEADHAFFNQTRPEVYDVECADLAWKRTLTFLKNHLN